MDNEEPEIILLYVRRMKSPYSPGRPYRPNTSCQLLFKSDKTAGILMAIPFMVCFALFGIFNLIAGTVLTTMACRRKVSQQTFLELQMLLQNQKLEPRNSLDPMKVVGTILLLTGSLLVLIGILLGVVACRSANYESRRRASYASLSGMPMSSFNGRTSFAIMGSANRKLSDKLKSKISAPNNKSESASTSAQKQTSTTVVDVHQNGDGVGLPVDDKSLRRSSSKPEGTRKNIKVNLLAQSDEVTNSSKSLTDVTTCCSDVPMKKACSVTWAETVTHCEQTSEPDKNSVIMMDEESVH